MTVRKAVSALLPLVLMTGAVAHAQSSQPDSSDPLKGFRLDPVPQTQPRPTGPQTSESTSPTTSADTPTRPRPQVTPPPVQPTATQPTPTRSAPTSRDTGVQPAASTLRQTSASERSDIAAPPQSAAPTEMTPSDTAPADTQPSTAIPIVPEETPTPDASTSSWPIWPLWIALAALLAAIGAWFWRKRSAQAPVYAEEAVAAPVLEPIGEPVAVLSEPEPAPLRAATPPAPRAKKKADEARAELFVEYLPDTAVISLANLTVSGRMRVTNTGKAAARNMQLRIALTSASAQQAQVISTFHKDAQRFPAKDIGDIDAGKSVDMDIELGIALGDLQSFTVNGQILFVPMLLANIAYAWEALDGEDKVEFACLIGRESKPPQPKMGPLRLDLGPRSFAGLGQRALAA